MRRTFLAHLVAVLLLVMAGAETFACDLSDACLSGAVGQDSGCDSPGGDNCFCCCQHIVPVAVITLEPGEVISHPPPPEPLTQLLSLAIPIEHPPQL